MPSSRRYSTPCRCHEAKSEVREPKAEGRPKSEGRTRQWAELCQSPPFRVSDFGIRISFGLRVSSFGLRPLAVMTISELLESVRRVEVRTNRLVNDMMVGAYLSHFKGRGMDFEELREYIPGDEVRDIDWNVTNRLGRPFVKRYREERELAAVLAMDVSASSAFGSVRRTKREFAAEIAGTLASSAARSSDKV